MTASKNDEDSLGVTSAYLAVHRLLEQNPDADNEELFAAVATEMAGLSSDDAEAFARDFSMLSFMLAREALISESGNWIREVPEEILLSCSSASGLATAQVRSLFGRLSDADPKVVETGIEGVLASASLPFFMGVSRKVIKNLESRFSALLR